MSLAPRYPTPAHIDLGIRVLAAAYLEMCSLQRGDPAKVELDDQTFCRLCAASTIFRTSSVIH